MVKKITVHLKIWRQKGKDAKGHFIKYTAKNVSTEISFLEMLDTMNRDLISQGKTPVEFESDCREGICGTCSLVINGSPHGPEKGTATCQLHMRSFKDGSVITVEPFRAKGFPIVKDLIVDRSAFDRIIQAGGFISVRTGSAPEANTHLVSKNKAEKAFLSAACIGCGACVAACKNASASLFVAAKISHLSWLPQGKVEKKTRVVNMIEQMDKEKFGACSNTGACSAACPKEISLGDIANMNKEYLQAHCDCED